MFAIAFGYPFTCDFFMRLDLGEPVFLDGSLWELNSSVKMLFKRSQSMWNRAGHMAMFNLTVKSPLKISLLHSMDTL